MTESVINIDDKIKDFLDEEIIDEDTHELNREKFIFKNIFMILLLIFVMIKLTYSENDNDKYYSWFVVIIYYIMKTYKNKKKPKKK